MKRTHEKERVAALSAGLAIVVLVWIAAEAFASGWIESIGVLSVWLYGPITAAVWGSLSVISYLLIVRAQRHNPALCPEHEEATREARGAATGELRKVPKCIEEVDALEKDQLAGLMSGFAITIAVWLALLSFAPPRWLDSIAGATPWIDCLVSIAVWSASAELMYRYFHASRRQRHSFP
jgi:hypothetical protein